MVVNIYDGARQKKTTQHIEIVNCIQSHMFKVAKKAHTKQNNNHVINCSSIQKCLVVTLVTQMKVTDSVLLGILFVQYGQRHLCTACLFNGLHVIYKIISDESD